MNRTRLGVILIAVLVSLGWATTAVGSHDGQVLIKDDCDAATFNAAIGPGQFILDLNVTREFKVAERVRLRPTIEFDNVLNKTVFSFGSEFIDFNAFGPTSSAATRQAFIDSFLVPTRTMRPRQIRLGIRMDF